MSSGMKHAERVNPEPVQHEALPGRSLSKESVLFMRADSNSRILGLDFAAERFVSL